MQIRNLYSNIVFRNTCLLHCRKERATVSKEEIIHQIIELLQACNDVPLLEFIRRLLIKSA